jgi:hypothetical protein
MGTGKIRFWFCSGYVRPNFGRTWRLCGILLATLSHPLLGLFALSQDLLTRGVVVQVVMYQVAPVHDLEKAWIAGGY